MPTTRSGGRTDRRSRRRVTGLSGLALGVSLALALPANANIGGGPTGCIHLCPAVWQNYVLNQVITPCVVGIGVSSTSPYDRDVEVIPGSTIDCGPLEVRVNQYDLTVEDGGFLLLAEKVLVTGSGNRIAALCDSVYDKHGFRIVTADDIDVASGGEFSATCHLGAGLIELRSDADITLAGSTVTANAQYAAGGEIIVRAKGNVALTSAVEARNTSTSGYYEGGSIAVQGDDVTISGGLSTTGTNMPGAGYTSMRPAISPSAPPARSMPRERRAVPTAARSAFLLGAPW
jgi:hypothetical protein